MKLHQITLATALVASVLSFTACDRKEPTKTETKTSASTTTTTSTSTAPVTASTSTTATTVATSATNATPPVMTTHSNLSPSMNFWVMGNRAAIMNRFLKEYPNMTVMQKGCIASADGDENYVKEIQPYMAKALTPEELAESDKFYASPLGQKYQAATKAKIEGSPFMPEISKEEQKALMTELSKPYMQKIQKYISSTDPKQAMAMLQRIGDTEKTRCKIA